MMPNQPNGQAGMPQMPQMQPQGGQGMPMQGPMGGQQGLQAPPQAMPQSPSDEIPPGQGEEPTDEENLENLVDYALSEANIAKRLRNKKEKDGTLTLEKIGNLVHQGWTDDEQSRNQWLETNKEWLKMALLVREGRTYPWPDSSNVKYPLLSTAAMQFSARAYPALVPSDGKVVKATVIPYDPDGKIAEKAERIAKHMSYQVMHCIPDWEEDMDKLLMTVAISGVCFKKTFYSSLDGYICSKLVYPENFCINYWAKSIEEAYRKTEILYYNENEYKEKVNNDEEFLDIDLMTPSQETQKKEALSNRLTAPPVDSSTPHVFLAQHTWYDLDGDGYEEPYIIVIHRDTKKVVRIIARWDKDGVKLDDNKKIVKIVPVEYFTAFSFIPNPDGSLYSLGFGVLLGPLNESVNTLVNQLVDSGTLSNLQAGFIGKGLRTKMGPAPFRPGEWRAVNATGDDLHKNIFPLPLREPSEVLLNLLNMLITSGNQLASIAEIFVGKMPGQNTPATTTQETVKQGMAVFTAVYKRIYRALASEFCKIHRLNRITPGILQQESKTLNMPLTASDYDDYSLIIPGGDPTGDSHGEKMAKVQMVGGMLQLGTIDPMKFTEWSLQANEVPGYQQLMKQPEPPPPDPKLQTEQAKQQTMQQKAQIDGASKQQDMQIKEQMAQLEAQAKAAELQYQQTKQAMELQGEQMKQRMDQLAQVNQQHLDAQKASHDLLMETLKVALASKNEQQMHDQKLTQNAEMHLQKKKQMKETSNNSKKSV